MNGGGRALVVIASVVVVVLLGAALAFALRDSGGEDSATPEDPASTETAASSSTASTSESSSSSSSPDEPSTVTEIPDDFRFAEESEPAYQNADGDNKVERSEERGQAWELDPCRPTKYPSDRVRTDMLTVTLSGPEYSKPIQLALYPDQAAARAVMAEFGRVLEACKDERGDTAGETTRSTWRVEGLEVGDEGFVAILRTTADGNPRPYGERVAVFRTANAVFLRAEQGEIGLGQEQTDGAEKAVRRSARRNEDRVCELVRCEAG